ncbi:hypothetical protein [Flavobacterium sp.]|uniref:hypothetical protein n=1 Tax=Flavobacterium sp. TaxID=239 RepID=UPI0039E489C8
MIEIEKIVNATSDDILNMLIHVEQPFKVCIYKSTQLFFSDTGDIARDFGSLAFAGQQLKEVSKNFDYNTTNNCVTFEIEVIDIVSLAETLLLLSYGYSNGDDDDQEMEYFDEMYDFLDKAEKAEIEIACPDLMEAYLDAKMEDENNAEDDDD